MQDTYNDGNIPSYRLNGFITKDGLHFLVDYAYTARLEVPENMVSLTLSETFSQNNDEFAISTI